MRQCLKNLHEQKYKSFGVHSANLYFPPHINVVGSDINGCYVLRCAVFYFLSTSSTFDESILIRSCFSWRLRMLNVVGFLWIFGSQSNTEVIHDAWDGGHTGAELRGSQGEICPILERHFSISVLSPFAPLSFWVKTNQCISVTKCILISANKATQIEHLELKSECWVYFQVKKKNGIDQLTKQWILVNVVMHAQWCSSHAKV